MSNLATSSAKAGKPVSRINRSISFPVAMHEYVTRRAERESRSFNWVVNDCIAKDLKRSARR